MGKENHDQNIAGFFEQALEIEQKSADIYAKLSKLFSHVPEVSDFWDELAKDEKQHRDTLKEIYDSLTNEQLSSFLNEDIISEERKNFILLEINDHQQKLMVFSKKYGDATSRRRVTIQST